jgi:hypothetical protein
MLWTINLLMSEGIWGKHTTSYNSVVSILYRWPFELKQLNCVTLWDHTGIETSFWGTVISQETIRIWVHVQQNYLHYRTSGW